MCYNAKGHQSPFFDMDSGARDNLRLTRLLAGIVKPPNHINNILSLIDVKIKVGLNSHK
jgi:hypothetical protein